MSATMTCKRCGACCTGLVGEILAWDKSHDAHCPAIAAQRPARLSSEEQA